MNYINEVVKRLEKNEINMEKCTEDDLAILNSILKKGELPKAYIQFMKVMGNGTKGKFMRGDSCFMNEIKDLRQGAIELLEENNSKNTITDNDFIFWMSQGCMFCFFKINEGDNPPVYFYNENRKDDKFTKITNSFTDFLIARLEMKKDLFKEVY
ncbi:SMI1/KNR4 family protein [Abyssisolibacter fermentans]|uniref:SMI1/KNR4 family protein n=1 Tax=Abyssisolibacter fermentans TaxID=1766203 RepID=UPI000836FCF8|nr:SMI1/KNR4 family protein [Abyssisolibacter fermentans]